MPNQRAHRKQVQRIAQLMKKLDYPFDYPTLRSLTVQEAKDLRVELTNNLRNR